MGQQSRSTVMRAFILLATLWISLTSPALAADEITNARGVIRSQEQALGRDDAATAYSYAAPAIRDMFPQADMFLSMVQRSYAPVYRHKSFEFGEAQIADGNAWEALYTLEPQPDGSLKIIGCVLLKAGQDV
jgi:Domain of unknown function (DUF4864)